MKVCWQVQIVFGALFDGCDDRGGVAILRHDDDWDAKHFSKARDECLARQAGELEIGENQSRCDLPHARAKIETVTERFELDGLGFEMARE